MKLLRVAATVALLLFVGATVGMLIAQEVSQPPVAESAGGTESVLKTDTAAEWSSADDPAAESPETMAVDGPAPAEEAVVRAPSTEQQQGVGEADAPLEVVSAAGSEQEPPCVVDAIYFHNTSRCHTCLEIEALAKAVLETEFASQVTEGRLRWSAIDMQRNRQYIEQYDLAMPTLILVRSIGDKRQDWVPLEETWALIRNESRFTTYIADSTRAFLEGCP